MATLFTKIIRWEIPSYKLFEDERTYAFLNINQPNGGNVLIVPKIEVDHFFELDDIYYDALFATAKRLAPVIKKSFDALRTGLVIEWLEVPHAHIKLFPIFAPGDVAKSDNEAILDNEKMLEIQQSILNELQYA